MVLICISDIKSIFFTGKLLWCLYLTIYKGNEGKGKFTRMLHENFSKIQKKIIQIVRTSYS